MQVFDSMLNRMIVRYGKNFDAFDKPALLNFSRQKIAQGNSNTTLNEFKNMKYIQFYM